MARSLPEGESLLVRTDFTDDAAWARTLAAVIASYDEDTMTGLTPVDDVAFAGLTPADLADLVDGQTYVFLADTTAMTDPEHPLLVVDTSDKDVRGDGNPVFRIAPRAMAEVEVNFLLANVNFEDYAGSVDDDGVYRGFDSVVPTTWQEFAEDARPGQSTTIIGGVGSVTLPGAARFTG